MSKLDIIASYADRIGHGFSSLRYMQKRAFLEEVLAEFVSIIETACKKNLNIPLEGEDIGHEAICYVVRDKETGKPKIKQILMSFPAGKEYVIKEGEENGFEGTPSEKEDRRR
jgi:hypothetical protein